VIATSALAFDSDLASADGTTTYSAAHGKKHAVRKGHAARKHKARHKAVH
jgi:hypothetical protein